MNRRITLAIAALLATSAIPVAVAQATIDAAANPVYVAEPVASVSKAEGLEGQLATSIAESLVADTSLNGSKITVQPVEDGVILLTGVVPTKAQAKRALEIAVQQAGEGSVASAIQPEEI
jgi:osmotically-inducible protein OsmY